MSKVMVGQKLFIEPSGNCVSGTIEDGTDTRVYSSEEAIREAFTGGDVEDGYIFIEVEVKRVVRAKSNISLVPFVDKKK